MLGRNSQIFEIDRSGRSQYGLSANVERSANPAALAAPPARGRGRRAHVRVHGRFQGSD